MAEFRGSMAEGWGEQQLRAAMRRTRRGGSHKFGSFWCRMTHPADLGGRSLRPPASYSFSFARLMFGMSRDFTSASCRSALMVFSLSCMSELYVSDHALLQSTRVLASRIVFPSRVLTELIESILSRPRSRKNARINSNSAPACNSLCASSRISELDFKASPQCPEDINGSSWVRAR
jgi:hypothetical protein